MKLRWLLKTTRVTADEVREYSNHHGISLMEAKACLLKQEGPVLQYLHQYTETYGAWETVPTTVEIMEIK